MYGMGVGPTSGRGQVLYLDGSYDLNGRAAAVPVVRTGGIPARRETGGQLFDYVPPPVVETVNTAAVVPVPAVVINSSGPVLPVPDSQVSDYFGLLPWWGWAGLGVGAWFVFGKGGRR